MLAKCPYLGGTYGLLAILGAGLASTTLADDAKTYTLAYQFDAGQDVAYSVDHQAQVVLDQGEAQQHIEHGSVTNKQYRVKSIDREGNAVLELQIDRVRMMARVDGGDEVTYDTDSGNEPPAEFRGIADTVGKPHVRVKVSRRGELLSIDWLVGGDQIAKPTKEDAASLDILAVLPEQPVKVGETWKEQFEAEVAATASLKKKVKIQREYTLKEVEGNKATIALKTVVLTPLHDPAQESQIINKTPKGTIVLDLERGIVISRTQSIDRVVVGFNGADSKVHNVSRRVETLENARVAIDAGITPIRR